MTLGLVGMQELNTQLKGKALTGISLGADYTTVTFHVDDGDDIIFLVTPHEGGARVSAVVNTFYGMGYEVAAVRLMRFDNTSRIMLYMNSGGNGAEIVTVELKGDTTAPMLRYCDENCFPISALFAVKLTRDYEEPEDTPVITDCGDPLDYTARNTHSA